MGKIKELYMEFVQLNNNPVEGLTIHDIAYINNQQDEYEKEKYNKCKSKNSKKIGKILDGKN